VNITTTAPAPIPTVLRMAAMWTVCWKISCK